MADEAYRAVFLRVHPTGKMVLSLTTESDGEEPRYAQLVAGTLGVALDHTDGQGLAQPIQFLHPDPVLETRQRRLRRQIATLERIAVQ